MANDALRLFAFEIEVLGQSSDDRPLVNLVMTAHARAVQDGDEGEDDAPIANLHIAFYIDEREYLTVFADFRSGVDFGFWTNIAHCFELFYELLLVCCLCLFCTAAKSLIEVHHGLHLVEVVGHFRELGIE